MSNRSKYIIICLSAFILILLSKLFYIQILDSKYKVDASNNSMVYNIIYPTRGIIYDRNKKIIVGNKVAYDLMVTPKEIRPFDTTLLSNILDIPVDEIKDRLNTYKKNKRKIGYRTIVFEKQVPHQNYMKFIELEYKFPGFKGQVRSIRDYPINAGGNLLGYVSEVDQDYIQKHEGEYKSGDYAGKTGIEAAREKDLRGEKGYSIYLRNSKNQIEDRYMNGEMDKEAIPGNDIITTIDADLQQYGQELMKNKVGSLIAIEPSTGEILALVSSPGINVNQLADIGKHYAKISKDPYKPMFNRAVQAPYPPGSVFKLVNGLIGLQEGVITPNTQFGCNMGYHYGNRKLGCHAHRSPLNLEEATMMSCNSYFCYVLKNILENKKYPNIDEALAKWDDYIRSFGFGVKLGSDFPSELSGNIPTPQYYNKIYHKGGWKFSTILSISIGQGEVGATPLQIANLCAILANRGYYIIPHIIKDSEHITIDPKYKERHYTLVDTNNFKKVIPGMWRAVNSPRGTGCTAYIAAVPGLNICGKTGTAQNPRGDDNSVFMCFAPMDHPKIAVAAYIEHGGFGATWAAPIASLLVEKYLNKSISENRKALEKRVLEGDLMHKVKTK